MKKIIVLAVFFGLLVVGGGFFATQKNRHNLTNLLTEVEEDLGLKKDTIAPTVLYSKYTMKVGENEDLLAKIPCGDNDDPRPSCVLEGSYDPDLAGTYPLVIVATDKSGNQSRNDLTLIVVDEYESTNEPLLTLAEAQTIYQAQGAKIGIDVSRWQEEIDWQAVKAAEIDFAFIRIGSQASFSAEPKIDPYFEQNIKGAKEAGIQVGVYFYSLAQTTVETTAQANFVLAQLKDYQLDLPVVFDWEAWNYFNRLNLSYNQLNQLAENFLFRVTEAGYQGMLYGSPLPLKKVWTITNYPVWLAHYLRQTTYDGDYQIWQFSSVGKVDGIEGEVDLNMWK